MKSRFTPQRGLELIYVGRLLGLGGLALVCFLALSNQLANAQVVSGSMVGNVTDASGGARPRRVGKNHFDSRRTIVVRS